MKKLNIAIDASFALGEKNGTNEYTNQLVKGLSEIDHDNNYTIFPFFTYIYDPDFKKYQPKLPSNFKLFLHDTPKKIIDLIWLKYKFLRRFYTPRFDIFHTTTFSISPKYMYKKLIVTVYDVSFYTHPQFHMKENVKHCQKGTVEAVKKADKIIAISNRTKRDLISYFDCPEEKILVTPLAYDDYFDKKMSDNLKNKIMNKYKIKKPFIFHLGSLEPRKNTLGLIKAYRFLPKRLYNKFDLVIGGGKGWMNNEVLEYARKHGLKNVKFVGYIPDGDLPALYQKAKCFIYPSFYEGFGIPPLEAMASGCPTLVSNNSSLPEICQNGALYCKPNDIEDISRKMEQLLTSKNEELIKKARNQANKFAWNKVADQTLELYKNF